MTYYLDILGNIGIFMILAMSLNVICGLTGLLQLGHAGFFAIGAYTAGLVSIYFHIPALGWGNFLLSASAGMFTASIFAVIIGLPCLRLRGDYLAIATLAFGEIVRLTLQNTYFPPATSGGRQIGGATGISLPSTAHYGTWWFIWIFVIITYVLLLNIKHSAIGRAFLAIREDEIAARSMGVNLPWFKTLSFVLSALFAGLAGALFAHKQLYISPKDFGLLRTIEILLMVVLGGLGSFSGAALAALLLIVLREWLGELPHVGMHRELIFALLLVLSIRFIPNGLMGLKEVGGLYQQLRKRFSKPGAGDG